MNDYLFVLEPLLFLEIIATCFSYFYVVYKFEIRSIKNVCIVLAAALIVGTVISLFDREHILELEFPALIILPILVFVAYKISFLNSIKLFWLYFIEISLFTSTLEHYLFLVLKVGKEHEKLLLFLAYLLSMLLLWILHFAWLRKTNKELFIPMGKTWIPLLIISVMMVLMISNYQYILRNTSEINRVTRVGTILAGVGGIAFTFLYHVLLYYINTSRDYRANLEISRSYNEQNKEYFTELLKRDEETRKFRHDYKSELMILRSYIDREEYEKLKEYLLKMETGMNAHRSVYYVGDEIADTILNFYLAELPDHTNITVVGNMSNSGISEMDMTIIVSNLLRNAVEELKNVGEGGSFLFECRHSDGELVIRSNNSVTEDSYLRLMKKGVNGTSKGEGHFGLGVSIIKDAVKRYDGSFYWKAENKTFEAVIRLFCK